jgi:rSAM/selenodomain-associated transferase 2
VRLSVIIPALNEAAHIERAVASAWCAGAAEVIVVDGGSDDATCQIASGLNCRLVSSPLGRARQQNAGAKLAGGDVLVFLHADCELTPGLADQLERTLTGTGRLHGALRQKIAARGLAYRLLERGNAARVRLLGLPYGDQAVFVRKDAFDQAGGFPEVSLMEDVMLMQRLRKLAWPALLPGPVVVSPRRWQRHGIVQQTLRNWWLLSRYACGARPEDLAPHYRRHDVD